LILDIVPVKTIEDPALPNDDSKKAYEFILELEQVAFNETS